MRAAAISGGTARSRVVITWMRIDSERRNACKADSCLYFSLESVFEFWLLHTPNSISLELHTAECGHKRSCDSEGTERTRPCRSH
jgi:hypothetical protein